jgi:hypothetical protein
MPHRFDLSVKSESFKECKPGFYLLLSTASAIAEYVLKVDAEHPAQIFYMLMAGEKKFHLTCTNKLGFQAVPVISMSERNIVLELPDDAHLVANKEDLGVITICKEGVYLTAERHNPLDSVEIHFVSLQSFQIQQTFPEEKYGSFDIWRLTTSEDNPSDRTVLISQGAWPQ